MLRSIPAVEESGLASWLCDRRPIGLRGRILIADDDPDTRAFYAWALRAAGWLVSEAADGFEAIGMAAALRPDAIVMDLCMPGLGGAEAAVCLKREARTRPIPIVACSGLNRLRAEPQALAAGCDTFVGKPCSPDALCAVLEELTAHREVEEPLFAGARSV